jgi:putative transposase
MHGEALRIAFTGALHHLTSRGNWREVIYGGMGQDIWYGLRQQIYLGDEAFVTHMKRQAQIAGNRLSVPQAQRRLTPPTLA